MLLPWQEGNRRSAWMLGLRRPVVVTAVCLTTGCSVIAVPGGGSSPSRSAVPGTPVPSGPLPSTPGQAPPTLSSPVPTAAPTVSLEPDPQRPDPQAPIRRPGLAYGSTAQLRYFDITVQRFQHGQDGISAAWRTKTCYTRPHPEARPDGRVRVSTGPWRAVVRDGETGGPVRTVAVDQIGIDPTWSPLYVTTQLALGECQTGWIAIRHGNPDLIWEGIDYAPADGDSAGWRGR